jgi:ribonuclease BN (tRNA processing enzyme)
MAGNVVITLLGTGDAFGSGGRLQTCFHVRSREGAFLIDCGASSCIAMKRTGTPLLDIDAILITHFHADHFAGLPFILIESRIKKRVTPLTIAGPPGVQARISGAMDVLFPGAGMEFPFPVRWVEYADGDTLDLGCARVTAWPVSHVPLTRPHALRIETDEKTIAYSGDTLWTEALRNVARGADVFLCEVSTLDGPPGIHLDLATLKQHRHALGCRKLVVTHMGEDVLADAHRIGADLDATMASDGLVLDL